MIIDEIFKPLYGKYCWCAKKGIGSFLTFEFGEPHLEVHSGFRTKEGIKEFRRFPAVHGDWHLWVYLCDWTITTHGKVKATSESRARDIDRAMGRLNGQSLIQVQVEAGAQTHFVFELGDHLHTKPNTAAYGTFYDQWLLYEPSGKVFTLRDDMKYSHNPGIADPTKKEWLPLD